MQFKPGQRVMYIGETTASLIDKTGIVIGQDGETNVNVAFNGIDYSGYRYKCNGVCPENIKLVSQQLSFSFID